MKALFISFISSFYPSFVLQIMIMGIFILFSAFFLLQGCSSVYDIQNFHPKSKFYQELNISGKDKEVKILTVRDSTIQVTNGIKINNDSLILLNEKIMEDKIISLKEIKDIDYNNFQISSAFLELKNGENLEAENIQISNGSMKFKNIKYISNNSFMHVNEINEISYKSRWKGTITGLIIGTLSGAAIGGLTHIIPANENRPGFTPPYQRSEYNTFKSFMIGTFSGAFAGAVVGWLIGYDFVYQF